MTEGDVRDELDRVVGLVGAPNVGKSVVFNFLANETVTVSNYPGTTVTTTLAAADGFALTDTPGVYGISSFTEEERVTRSIIFDIDAAVNVVDATHLERDLFLTLQLLDMGIPTVVALNMMDEARADGLAIDPDVLEARLGVPVVPTVATEGEGLGRLADRIEEASAPSRSPLGQWYDQLPTGLEATRAERTLLVEGDEPTAERVHDRLAAADGESAAVTPDGGSSGLAPDGLRDEIYAHRRSRVERLVSSVLTHSPTSETLADRFDALLLNPLTGIPFVLGMLVAVYWIIGDLVAQKLVNVTEVDLIAHHWVPFVHAELGGLLPHGPVFDAVRYVLLNGTLGLLTADVRFLFGVLLPLIVSFNVLMSLAEDSGILPRFAVLTDRGMSRIGLNGRAIIPMIIGLGCVTMAIISTRMVGSRRERLIATALLGLAVPCSAQLGVILGLISSLGPIWWVAYVGVILLVFGLAGLALDRVLPGEGQGLVTELPRLRVPRLENVAQKTRAKTRMFLSESIPMIGGGSLVLSLFTYTGGMGVAERTFAPVMGLLDLPPSFGHVLLMGIIRRDFAAAGMTDLALSHAQLFIGLVVITLFVPCILSMAMLGKEHDVKSGLLMWAGSWVTAFVVGGILAAVIT